MPNLFALLFDWLLTHLVAMGFGAFILVAVLARGPLFGIEEPLYSPRPAQGPAPAEPESQGKPEQPKATAHQAVEAAQATQALSSVEPAPAAPAVPESRAKQAPAAVGPAGQQAASSPSAQPAPSRDAASHMQESGEGGPDQPESQPRRDSHQDSVFRPTGPDPADHQQFVPLALVEEDANPAQQPAAAASIAPVEADEPVATYPVDEAPVDTAALLQQARGEFWNGSLEAAERLYLHYLALEPTDANSFGELGNLYQSMGRSRDALDAYYEAGVRFKAQGEAQQLKQIVELLIEARDPRVQQLSN